MCIVATFSMVYTIREVGNQEEPVSSEPTVILQDTVEVERSHPLLVSGGTITSYYGERYDGFHVGLDIASKQRDQILPYADGSVLDRGYSPVFGNWVRVWHSDWLITRYCHLSTIYYGPEKALTKYEPLGRTGETGMALGDHLHFEMLLFIEEKWVKVDPALFLNMSRDDLNYSDFLRIWNRNKDNYK